METTNAHGRETDMRERNGQAAPWIVVTGLDGSGKSGLVETLADALGAHRFRLPREGFVKRALWRSGQGRPMGDVQTDRLIFALDARLSNYEIRQWRRHHRCLVSQRGWTDNFVFGAVQGVSYEDTDRLLHVAELERPSAWIHLVADPDVAFERIRHDPDRDKYETRRFMRRQYEETVRLYEAIQAPTPVLAPLHDAPAILIDTTALSPDDVAHAAGAFLARVDDCAALAGGEGWTAPRREVASARA
jgi:thymidylate kinase